MDTNNLILFSFNKMASPKIAYLFCAIFSLIVFLLIVLFALRLKMTTTENCTCAANAVVPYDLRNYQSNQNICTKNETVQNSEAEETIGIFFRKMTNRFDCHLVIK